VLCVAGDTGRGRPRSVGGGIPLEHCSVIDDERSCALEYNVVRWGKTALAPEAGVAVYVRGRRAGSLRPASTTTPILRSVHLCSPAEPRA